LVYIIELDRTVSLSKEILEQYQSTRKELRRHSDSYKELIENYPKDTDFIKGCLYPVEIQTAIDAVDGKILSYNTDMVEVQELSLIRELDAEIYSFLARWHVRSYIITDELYLSSLVGVLYSTLPATIINLRSKKIYTAEANSFHLEHFFRSRLDMWDQAQALTNETRYWLYQNLNYLMTNTSKNTTLDIILTKIFETNGIGVGTFTIERGQPECNSSIEHTESCVIDNDSRFIAKKLNNKYEIGKDKYMDTETIINIELFNNPDLDTTINDDALNSFVKETTTAINNTSYVSQKTKLLDIDSIKLFKIFGNDPFTAIMDHWLYFSVEGLYTAKTVFIDPNTKDAFTLSPLDGLYFLYYMLSELVGVPDFKVEELKYGYVVNNDITIEELTKDMFNLNPAINIAKMIKADMPTSVGVINTAEEFGTYLGDLKEFYMKVWIYDSNINNGAISANIKHMVSRMYKHKTIPLRPDRSKVSFKELLTEKGVVLNLNSEYNKIETISALFKTFTGVDVNENIKVENRIKLYAELLLKLTSYTTQVIKSVDDNKTLYAPYSTLEAFHSEEGLINITEASIISPYETNHSLIKCKGNNFRELISGNIISPTPVLSSCVERLGVLHIPNYMTEELTGEVTVPKTWAEILSVCYDEYAPLVTIRGNDFEDVLTDTSVYSQSQMVDVTEIDNNNLVVHTDELNKNVIVGIVTTPNLIVEFDDNDDTID
jgi:hypothetical protein